MTTDFSPSLLDLPTELILHIIKMLPQSPYHKCLNVCRRLDEIENGYIPERSAMCLCRLHRHSPNLPSQQLKLRICMHTTQCQLDVFIGIIKRRPPTCTTKITGEDRYVEVLKSYLNEHDEHPNVKIFLSNCEPTIVYLSRVDLFNKIIDLRNNSGDNLKREFTALHLTLTLGENQNLTKQFCKILPGSCVHRVMIDCNTADFHLFNHFLENYINIFDILDFRKKVYILTINHNTGTPIHTDLLNGFDNLGELNITINDTDLENVKNRMQELAQVFKQANLKYLNSFKLFEHSSFECAEDLIPAWADLLAAIPSKNLQRVQIIGDMKQCQNQLTTHNTSFSKDISRFTNVQFLTIHHVTLDNTLLKMLLPLRRLRNLDLRINLNMLNKDEIDKLCHKLETCNSLEEITFNMPSETKTLFDVIFVSLAKVPRFKRINLYVNPCKEILEDECFEKLELIKNLRHVNLQIKIVLNNEKKSHEIGEQLEKQIMKYIPKHCIVSIDYHK